MRSVCTAFVLVLVGLLGSCSSDSDSNTFTSEERELRTLLNNEWVAVKESKYLPFELPMSEDFIPNLLESDLFINTGIYNRSIVAGMNKQGGFYLIDEYAGIDADRESLTREPLLDLLYSCTTQQGNKFTGTFTGMSVKGATWEFYVRKADENTMHLVIIHVKESTQSYPMGLYSAYIFKKQGPWEEKTTFRKIFQRYRYYDPFIDQMIMAEENYERDVARGGCR